LADRSTDQVLLSIVIPVYNEAHRLPNTLDQILSYLKGRSYPAEVLVVENGSLDGTLEIARAYTESHPNIRLLQTKQRGKGLAVRYGMLEARGEFRFMCDADLSMPIEEIERFLPPELEAFDVAIASREAPGAVRYNEPPYRHFVGRIFNYMIRALALPELHDTQCGFKCFRAEAALDIFKRQSIDGWSFDVEILYIAGHLGYQIVEIPIPWYFNADSKVRVISDSIRMGWDLLAIRRNAARGVYDGKV
jgi:dolichyl-phosphate beta-glucosyltransferase